MQIAIASRAGGGGEKSDGGEIVGETGLAERKQKD